MKFINSTSGRPLSFSIDSVHYEVPVGGEIEIPDRVAYAVQQHGIPLQPKDAPVGASPGGESRVIVDTSRAKADVQVAGEEAVSLADNKTIVVRDQSKPGPESAALSEQYRQEKAAAYHPELANEEAGITGTKYVHPMDLDPKSTHGKTDKTSAESHFPNLRVDPEAMGTARKGTGDYAIPQLDEEGNPVEQKTGAHRARRSQRPPKAEETE